MPTKQWLQVEVDNEIVMHFLLSFISNLDFKPLFVPILKHIREVSVTYFYWLLSMIYTRLSNVN